MNLNLNNKKFVNAKNTSNGEVSHETIFNYYQVGERIEATYSGGSITNGHLLGFMTSEKTFTMAYHHINEMNELRIGEWVIPPFLIELMGRKSKAFVIV